MKPKLEEQMRNIRLEDRHDPVAVALRRFYLRIECCPCLNNPSCLQCRQDKELIEEAWKATNGIEATPKN